MCAASLDKQIIRCLHSRGLGIIAKHFVARRTSNWRCTINDTLL